MDEEVQRLAAMTHEPPSDDYDLEVNSFIEKYGLEPDFVENLAEMRLWYEEELGRKLTLKVVLPLSSLRKLCQFYIIKAVGSLELFRFNIILEVKAFFHVIFIGCNRVFNVSSVTNKPREF